MELTLIQKALQQRDVTVIEQLLRQGANVETRNSYQQTLLLQASGMGEIAIMQILLSYHADVEALADYGHRPLMHAASKRSYWKQDEVALQAVITLANHAPEWNAVDKYGWSALHHAAYDGHTDTVRYLINAGADWQLRNEKRETPLSLAIRVPQPHPYEDRQAHQPSHTAGDIQFGVVMLLLDIEEKNGLHWKRRQSLLKLAKKFRCPEVIARIEGQ
ncbi:MAG: ankyrin repeat domain-containing protein [Planctomycetes bacterium]|nr:ankyrin repeat domain-containing protein [Planctomycetota bacterium]